MMTTPQVRAMRNETRNRGAQGACVVSLLILVAWFAATAYMVRCI